MELLKQLANLLGPSGAEQEVRSLIQKEIKKYVDEVRVDKFGNLIAHKKGKGARVMLAAHMDEIGLMCSNIEDDGKIKISAVGGIDPVTLVGQQVYLLLDNGKIINGVISFFEIHEGLEIDEMPLQDDLYVDTGLDKDALEKLGVATGTYIVPRHTFITLGNKDIVSGKAFDDRIGCYALIELAKRLKNITKEDMYYVFTVQEEVGLYGSETAVYDIDPDWGIAVDNTVATDSGDPKKICLGKGPCVTIMDAGMIANRCLNGHIAAVAKKNKIPLQKEVVEAGTTDATKIMMSRGGVPSAVLGIPLRNMHSTISVAHIRDIENLIKLLELLMKNPPKVCIV
ncbi:M42 family metallopeptidase [Candidatus Woesearchaeota archaeon]|nr:M42 family metallopeptidase [Candidatus Woesearchaeota archaeon]MBW3017873.1 M42 family metallopeptidase [Candidatus Woesearchaeota archaeon]